MRLPPAPSNGRVGVGGQDEEEEEEEEDGREKPGGKSRMGSCIA